MTKKLYLKSLFLYIASSLLPLTIILIGLNVLQVTPFGDNTLVFTDANGLYINYLGYAGRFFKGMEGFFYSFEKGLGGNMMPHMTGTIINPFFTVFSFFNVSDYTTAFTCVSVLNFCGCGLTMYILLASVFGNRRSNLIFSTSYALSGFLVANVFQVIFFTGPLMLPLMVLGLRMILQGKTPIVYFLSLSFCILTNTYFGFTLCVFSALLFFIYLWLRKDELRGKRMALFVHYGLVSVCSGLIPIAMWLPSLMGIKGGRLDQTGITDFSSWEKMPFIDIFTKLFTGANTAAQLMDGLPNIYVGLLPVFLVVLFFMNKKISKRAKMAVGGVLAFYMLGFYIIAFDMLLHAGTTTNWFNFRYSYIFSFVLIMIAAREWLYLDEVSFHDLKRCFIGMVIAVIIIFSKQYEYVMGSEVILDFALLTTILLAYRLYRTKPKDNPKSLFEIVTIMVVSAVLCLNYVICTKNIMIGNVMESEYQQTVSSVNTLVKAIHGGDTDFYRMEINKQRSGTAGNDPMLYGYNGVGHGGSNERNFVRKELSKLGIQWYDMRNYYAQGIPAATDALLGIKYLIANEDVTEEKNYIRITDMKKMGFDLGGEVYDVYRSTTALPIGFVSDKDVNMLELDYDDLFDNLNRVWSSISGSAQLVYDEEDEIVFRTINLADTEEMDAKEARRIVDEYESKAKSSMIDSSMLNNEEGQGFTQDADKSYGDTSNSASNDDGTIVDHKIMDKMPVYASSVEFSFTAQKDGPIYVYHRAAFSDIGGSSDAVIKYMGWYHKGDIVRGYLPVEGEYVNRITFEEFAGRFRAAYADLDALQSMSDTVTSRPSTIEKVKDSHLKGTVTVEEGQELLFTIPWDTGWTCYIDGQRVDLTKVLGVFMAAEVAPGGHTFEMFYKPDGMDLGLKISAAATVVLLIYLIYGHKLIDRLLIKEDMGNNSEKEDDILGETNKSEETIGRTDYNSAQKKEVEPNDSV